ncbi:hypothetical protein F5Y16DRAFT_242523 [Xylariaceae sp. FL0255]|nr:hypothetical protein F5Y16DRAFT_242523 [Xylariaceae sp. FL0255]
MGFTSGFTGGVTLTLGIAYLTVLAHRRNREQQSAILRQQTLAISSLSDPLPPILPPTRAQIAAAERANFIDTAKDRWNAEVENAVRKAQTTDWDEVREGLETAVGRLWVRLFSDAQSAAEKGEEKSAAAARQLKDKAENIARQKAESVAAAAKSAYANAKAKSENMADQTASKAGEKAEEAKGSILGAIGGGIKKGKEALGKTKAAVVGAEDKVESELIEKSSPVERTLRQRYERPADPSKQSVEEVLAARYLSEDKKDPVRLRGL